MHLGAMVGWIWYAERSECEMGFAAFVLVILLTAVNFTYSAMRYTWEEDKS